jgi:hypothetical protein
VTFSSRRAGLVAIAGATGLNAAGAAVWRRDFAHALAHRREHDAQRLVHNSAAITNE